MEIKFSFNALYREVFSTKHRYIDVFGGRGRGGSHFGTEYFLNLLTQPYYFRGYFVRQVLNDIKDSLFQDIKDRISENPTLNINDFKINESNYSLEYIPTGNKVISKGVEGSGKRTAKLKSLAGATHVLIEEADEMQEEDFDQLDLSLRTTKTESIQIIRIFNPPQKSHWIWRDYNLIDVEVENHKGEIEQGWYKAQVKDSADILAIFSTYKDNIKNLQPSTMARFEMFKERDFSYYCNQVLGLISEGAKGRIYSGWIPISKEEYNRLDLPKVYGLDFGYSDDPTALVEVKYNKKDRYGKELIYEAGLTNPDIAQKLYDLGITESDLIIADYGGGGDKDIAELRRGFVVDTKEGERHISFNIVPTIKGQGSINFGIKRMKAVNIHYTETSLNIINEYQDYKWRQDRDKNNTEIPIDKNNHLMDAWRYVEQSKDTYF